jgi:hypothetical protein
MKKNLIVLSLFIVSAITTWQVKSDHEPSFTVTMKDGTVLEVTNLEYYTVCEICNDESPWSFRIDTKLGDNSLNRNLENVDRLELSGDKTLTFTITYSSGFKISATRHCSKMEQPNGPTDSIRGHYRDINIDIDVHKVASIQRN